MADTNQSHQLPITPGEVKLGRTLPSLLDEACDRHPHNRALNQRREQSWLSLSSQAFRAASEEVALGLLNLGLTKGDRVGLFMHSDVNFCLADIGCLMAGLVDVPIDLDEATATIEFILQHTESKALVISDANLLRQIAPQLANLTHLQSVIVAETDANELPQFPSLPQRLQVLSLADIRARGRTLISEDTRQRLRAAIAPTDLATIIYALGSAEHLGINLDELQSVQQANTQPDSWQKLGQNGSCAKCRGELPSATKIFLPISSRPFPVTPISNPADPKSSSPSCPSPTSLPAHFCTDISTTGTAFTFLPPNELQPI
jgi:non-ribosomal peptide synthetase component F